MRQKGIINRMHKGLRTWLFETGIKIQETDFLEAGQGKAIAADIRNIIMVIERKSTIDEKYVFPILVKQAPFFVNIMDTENQKIGKIADQLGGFINAYIEPGTGFHHMSIGFSIQQVYNELMGAVLTYMNRLELMLKELESAAGSEGMMEELEEALLLNLDFGKTVMPKEWIFKSMSDRELDHFMNNRHVLKNEWLRMELNRIAQSAAFVNHTKQGGYLKKMVAA
jgi:hypothetical protein